MQPAFSAERTGRKCQKPGQRSGFFVEPISKSPEEDNEASELYEAEEVLGVVFPTDEDAALPLNPSKEALHERRGSSWIAAAPFLQSGAGVFGRKSRSKENPFGAAAVVVSACVLHAVVVIPVAAKSFAGS
jgi:hypothetical protein